VAAFSNLTFIPVFLTCDKKDTTAFAVHMSQHYHYSMIVKCTCAEVSAVCHNTVMIIEPGGESGWGGG
jgi:hypothetical protein